MFSSTPENITLEQVTIYDHRTHNISYFSCKHKSSAKLLMKRLAERYLPTEQRVPSNMCLLNDRYYEETENKMVLYEMREIITRGWIFDDKAVSPVPLITINHFTASAANVSESDENKRMQGIELVDEDPFTDDENTD